MDIEEIREFTKNKDAWYHVIVADYMNPDDIVKMQDILHDSEIEGTFLITNESTGIKDITEYMTKHRIKEKK